jgi:hypothetical protein
MLFLNFLPEKWSDRMLIEKMLAPIIDATSIASKIRDDFIVVILIAPIIIVMTLQRCNNEEH